MTYFTTQKAFWENINGLLGVELADEFVARQIAD